MPTSLKLDAVERLRKDKHIYISGINISGPRGQSVDYVAWAVAEEINKQPKTAASL